MDKQEQMEGVLLEVAGMAQSVVESVDRRLDRIEGVDRGRVVDVEPKLIGYEPEGAKIYGLPLGASMGGGASRGLFHPVSCTHQRRTCTGLFFLPVPYIRSFRDNIYPQLQPSAAGRDSGPPQSPCLAPRSLLAVLAHDS